MGRGETVILMMSDERAALQGQGCASIPAKGPALYGCKTGVQVVFNWRTGSSSYLTTSLKHSLKKLLISRYYAATSYKASDKAKRASQEPAYAC